MVPNLSGGHGFDFEYDLQGHFNFKLNGLLLTINPEMQRVENFI